MVHQLFRRLVFGQILLGILASCMAERNPGLLLIAGTLAALSWHVVEGPTGRPMSRFVTMAGALAATVYVSYEFYQTGGDGLLLAIAHFMMWLQIVLLYSEKHNREYAQLLVLSLMQIISACAITISMIFGIMLAAILFTVTFHGAAVPTQDHQRCRPP